MILLNKAKNYIANGAMDFWQRGLTVTNIAAGTFFADRFQFVKSGTAACNVARDTDVPTLAQSSFTFPYSSLLTVTTALSSPGATDYAGFRQKIEGQFFAPLAGRPMVLSFWVKSSIVGTFPIQFTNTTTTKAYVSTYTVNAINTWEKKSISLTHDSTGTWNYNTSSGLEVYWYLCYGTSYLNPTPNTWISSDLRYVSGNTNFFATNGNTLRITGVQLEEGTEASNFERMGGFWDDELRLCQRYFEKSYDTDIAPGTSVSLSQLNAGTGDRSGTGWIANVFPFKATKRIAPTFNIYDAVGNINAYTSTATTQAGTNNVSLSTLSTTMGIRHIYNWILSSAYGFQYAYTADAEL